MNRIRVCFVEPDESLRSAYDIWARRAKVDVRFARNYKEVDSSRFDAVVFDVHYANVDQIADMVHSVPVGTKLALTTTLDNFEYDSLRQDVDKKIPIFKKPGFLFDDLFKYIKDESAVGAEL